jgi:hypothetical protein
VLKGIWDRVSTWGSLQVPCTRRRQYMCAYITRVDLSCIVVYETVFKKLFFSSIFVCMIKFLSFPSTFSVIFFFEEEETCSVTGTEETEPLSLYEPVLYTTQTLSSKPCLPSRLRSLTCFPNVSFWTVRTLTLNWFWWPMTYPSLEGDWGLSEFRELLWSWHRRKSHPSEAGW